jgi:8-oxo-dGTP diphosphatase
MPSTGPDYVHIAVGILRNGRGEVLVCQRPAHKLYPGEWEFPGGKVERGETVAAALRRELREELGIEVRASQPLIRLRHVYPELSVDLDTWAVAAYDGTPQSTEHPAIAWVAPEALPRWPLLAADRPIVNAVRLPEHFIVTPDLATSAGVLERAARLPRGLLRLRLPGLTDEQYRQRVRELAPALRETGHRLIVDRDPAQLTASGADGFHATAALLARLRERPVPRDQWFGASCHSAAEILQACAVGADYVVLGPVRATPSHPGAAALGWAGFAALAADAGLPAYAIGGVGPADLEDARRHGAQGVAGISAYWRGF